MTRIGILGLDTSHAKTFAETFERTASASVTAVWDGGAVRDAAHVEQFCREFDATRYDEPLDMVDDVDAVMVLSVDWDTHASLAVPFLEAGIPTFVDKPVAGRLADVEAIADAAANAPLFGGSAVPFHPSITTLPADRSARTLYATGFNDPFYYGAHLVDVVRSLAGADWTVVMPVADPGTSVTVLFDDDSFATLRFDAPSGNSKYAVLDVSDSVRTALVEMDDDAKPRMYEAFVDAFLATVEGRRDDADRLLDGSKLLLAANLAHALGRPVTRRSDSLAGAHVDGEAFRDGYAERIATGGALPATRWAAPADRRVTRRLDTR